MLKNFCFNVDAQECILTIEYGEIIYATLSDNNTEIKKQIVKTAKELIDFFYENGYTSIVANKMKIERFSVVKFFGRNSQETSRYFNQKLDINHIDEILESMLFYVTEPEEEHVMSMIMGLKDQVFDKYNGETTVYDGAITIVPDHDAQYFSCFVHCNTAEEQILKAFLRSHI